MMKLIAIIFAAAISATVGCGSQRPVLYPNAHLNQVGTSAAERDIDLCIRTAEDYVASGGRNEKALEGAAVGGGTGAAVGAAAGAAGGAIVGRAGTAAAVGAAGGGAAGVIHGLIHGLGGRHDPDPIYKNFVNRCLRERGYDPIGWR
jgi:outer membrane lipoprotein SlyB